MNGDDATAVEIAAVKLLAIREHSRQELRRKLRVRHADLQTIDTVLVDLERRRLLDDGRFTEAYVRYRSDKGYGPLRIRAELAQRGVDERLVADWVDGGVVDWHEVLVAAALRKFGDGPAGDRRAMARRGRFLEQRGFPVALIMRYLHR